VLRVAACGGEWAALRVKLADASCVVHRAALVGRMNQWEE